MDGHSFYQKKKNHHTGPKFAIIQEFFNQVQNLFEKTLQIRKIK